MKAEGKESVKRRSLETNSKRAKERALKIKIRKNIKEREVVIKEDTSADTLRKNEGINVERKYNKACLWISNQFTVVLQSTK